MIQTQRMTPNPSSLVLIHQFKNHDFYNMVHVEPYMTLMQHTGTVGNILKKSGTLQRVFAASNELKRSSSVSFYLMEMIMNFRLHMLISCSEEPIKVVSDAGMCVHLFDTFTFQLWSLRVTELWTLSAVRGKVQMRRTMQRISTFNFKRQRWLIWACSIHINTITLSYCPIIQFSGSNYNTSNIACELVLRQ